MAANQYGDYSPQAGEATTSWPSDNIAQLQHAPSSNPAAPDPASSSADLAYQTYARGNRFNNPPPDGWLYPHKKGIGSGSNLEPFKAEIEARTQRGENCKAIAAALNAMGVQTSDRAISRVRIRWGMRKRAQRKVKTPPPDSDAARLSAKSKVQAMRKAELIRMTREGMSAEDIYQNLTSRGMELKKGVATVLRLQSAWGVARDEKRWLGNFRHQCHKKAKAQQVDAFRDIAKELGVHDIDGWVQEKMREQAARQARHELALKLMGEHAPSNPERRKLQKPRRVYGSSTKEAQATDASEGSEDGGSDDEPESDSDFPGPATNLSFGVVDSPHQGDHVAGNDGSLPSDRQSGFQSGKYAAETTNETLHVAEGVEANEYGEYVPMNDQTDDSMYDVGDEHHGATSIASRASARLIESIPPSISGSHIQISHNSGSTTNPTPASRLVAQTAPMQTFPTLSHPPCNNSVVSPAQSTESSVTQSNTSPTPGSLSSGLVVPPEEAEANKTTLSTLDQYNAAAKIYKELLEARTSDKPVLGSLTCMPPSAKEVEGAKRKLKEATQAMMLALD
ncbi:hypothetical protein Daus18300_013347 [Diaporthe australafricana]|uniref:Clr5 domain-containing protein n=1 Tax=Diaporthe australafricana TaxID=127596 RepID=A0ABR3VZR5_9PEZI